MKKLVLATSNAGKLAELRALVSGLDVELRAIDPDVEETGCTFEENARIKALAAHEKTGEIALADDSGLEVDALSGAPGIRSARFSGEGATPEKNNLLLVEKLRALDPPYPARFRCALVVAGHGDPIVVVGACEGEIILAPRGTNGFGYDPHFVARGQTRTMAELSSEEKNRISHRSRALRKLRPILEVIFR
jgi:XTP/dITP diphosphohydrolase